MRYEQNQRKDGCNAQLERHISILTVGHGQIKRMNEKEIKKLTSLAYSKYRQKHGLFLVEGAHSVAELLKSQWDVETLILTRQAEESGIAAHSFPINLDKRIPVQIISERTLKRLSSTDAPQGVLAVARIPIPDLERISSVRRIIIADGVRDPGNLGTIIRTAAAFGFEAFITTLSTADVFSPKVVRSSQGAIFSLMIAAHIDNKTLVNSLRESHIFYALTPRAEMELPSLKIAPRFALIIGAEIAGVSPELLAAVDFRVGIAMPGPIESLNAAVAAGIALYEFSRRS
jgi:TrmH family RNA methyltransferase